MRARLDAQAVFACPKKGARPALVKKGDTAWPMGMSAVASGTTRGPRTERMENFVFDPRDFISQPYRQCPYCGAEDGFGVLMVLRDHYVRRCRVCLREATCSLPPLNKKVIYLDQFAISNMMKALNPEAKAYKKGSVDPYWAMLFGKLDSLCKLQLIICPDSTLHWEESALSPQLYRPLKRMYEQLSHGVSFSDPALIKQIQIADDALNWIRGEHEIAPNLDAQRVVNGEINAWQERLIFSADVAVEQECIDELRSTREESGQGLREHFAFWAQQKPTFEDQFQEEVRGFVRGLLAGYLRSQAKLAAIFQGRGQPTRSDLHPDACSSLILSIHSAFGQAGVPDSDLWPKTLDYLMSGSLRNVPFIKISATLCAGLAVRAASGQKRPPNRGMMSDIEIISLLLPYCHAMFIDNECRGLLREKPVCDRLGYGTKLFSPSKRDDFLAYLDNIRSAASPERIEKVREAYGEDWAKPYTALYQPAKGCAGADTPANPTSCQAGPAQKRPPRSPQHPLENGVSGLVHGPGLGQKTLGRPRGHENRTD